MELDALSAQLDRAMAAELPSLVEIRRCRALFIECLARRVLEVMRADEKAQRTWIGFDVISNENPVPGAPRGICSPLKTKEIRQFEESARRVFGRVGPCSTSWED